MPDPERGTKKVSESAIKEIQRLGMSQAIQRYTSGNGSPEFRTAVERYYSPQRLKAASKAATPTGGPKMSNASTSTPVKMPESAPAAASRKTGKSTAEQALGTKNVQAINKNVSTPISKVGNALAATRATNANDVGKALSGIGKKLGLNNPFKPRKR